MEANYAYMYNDFTRVATMDKSSFQNVLFTFYVIGLWDYTYNRTS